jgi:hypothetical protein
MRDITRIGLTSAAALAIVLGGCKRSGDASDSASQTSPQTAAQGADGSPAADPAGAKLSAYTQAYNKLIGTFGLTETAKSYDEEQIARKSPSDSVSITDGWVDQGVAAMKKARAMTGGNGELDQRADRLIAALDAVMARLAPLKIYYDAKSYKDDALARGKREDPQMRAEFAAALAALKSFDGTLTQERHARDDTELAQLKARGDLVAYNSKLALRQAEQLVDLFNTPGDLRDPAKFARGDELVRALETALNDQRQAYTAAKAKAGAGDAPSGRYESLASYLTSLAGDYRDLKESHEADEVNDMVKEYNNAIEAANDID